MVSSSAVAAARGVVVAHVPDPDDHASEHERQTLLSYARRIAALTGRGEGGFHATGSRPAGPLYFVPSSTLTLAQAQALGIHGPEDLFGGVVPHAFVGTKAISHPLHAPLAVAVPGWNPDFAARVDGAVLDGVTVFSLDDAHAAGRMLLARGPLRLKPVRASGGRGQSLVRSQAELSAGLQAMAAAEVAQHGLVLEEHLEQVRTVCVGQVQVADLLASYFGFQRLTTGSDGQQVYGGSDLTVLRGDFEVLLAAPLSEEVRLAVQQARRYDAAVRACYPGFFASRSNYDIALGRDAQGRMRSGVLEQSWRVGGATGPELAALEAFRRDPHCLQVRASCHEVFGDSPEPPGNATVHFRGSDPQLGRLTKYTVLHAP